MGDLYMSLLSVGLLIYYDLQYSKFQIIDATWTWTHCYDWLRIYTCMYMIVYVWCVSLNHVSVFVIFLSYIWGRVYLEYRRLCSKHTEKELHIWHYDSDFIGGSGWLIFEEMGGLAILVVWQLGWLNGSRWPVLKTLYGLVDDWFGLTRTCSKFQGLQFALNIQKYLENQRFPGRTMIYQMGFPDFFSMFTGGIRRLQMLKVPVSRCLKGVAALWHRASSGFGFLPWPWYL